MSTFHHAVGGAADDVVFVELEARDAVGVRSVDAVRALQRRKVLQRRDTTMAHQAVVW